MTNQWVVFESHEHLWKPQYKSTRVDELLISFIIWQAPRVAKQDEPNLVLWLATQAGKMERYCLLWITRFVLTITIRWSPNECTVVFFHKLFSMTCKKIFCDFSVEIELENEKTEMHHHFCTWLASFSVLKN